MSITRAEQTTKKAMEANPDSTKGISAPFAPLLENADGIKSVEFTVGIFSEIMGEIPSLYMWPITILSHGRF
jgi:hypothetical protein